MKKGDYAPRVRARWVKGWYPAYTTYQLPTWCRPYNFFAVVFVEGGIPFPAEVTAEDCGPAQWCYVPNEGGVIWRGNFNTGLISGEWTYKQTLDNNLISYNRFSLTYNDGVLNPRVIYNSGTQFVTGDWDGSHPRNPQCTTREPGVTPWVGMSDLYMQYLRYSEIRDWGSNPDDTRPLSWTDSGDP